ncbi:MAG: manganese efflux pump MntP family protein [Clostridiales bacterium]|nr:manganese efflux pump MntP family protein [Clostridiales bacterium]
MQFYEIFLISVALAMDAFAIAVANGMAVRKNLARESLRFGVYFGVAQALMAALGWVFGAAFESYIISYDHWVAFGLLAFIGGKMIFEAIGGSDEAATGIVSNKKMLVLSVATSIDALAIGISLAVVNSPIIVPAIVIGVVAFALSGIGVVLGRKIGDKLANKAEIIGGLVLILLGVKILVEHLGIL